MLKKCLEKLINNDDYDIDNNKRSTSSTIFIPKL